MRPPRAPAFCGVVRTLAALSVLACIPVADTSHLRKRWSIPTFAVGGGEKNDYVLTGWRTMHDPSEMVFDAEKVSYFIASSGRKRGHGMQVHSISESSTRLVVNKPLWAR